MKSLSQQFLDFCRSKPADERYDYTRNDGCAYFRFLHASGFPVESVFPGRWRDHAGAIHKIPTAVESALKPRRGDGPGLRISTFGALADRLGQALSPTLAAAAAREAGVGIAA